MLGTITTYLREGKTYCAIEVCEIGNKTQYLFLETERKKRELQLTQKEVCNTLEELGQYYRKGSPTSIIIHTKDVLSKIIPATIDHNEEAIVEKAFPNFNFDGFYYELTSFGANTIVSIIKKEKVGELLHKFSGLKMAIVHFSLGVSALTGLQDYINSTCIQISNAEIKIAENTIQSIQPLSALEPHTNLNYEINGLSVEGRFLLGFSGIISFISKAKTSYTNFETRIKTYQSEFGNRHFFTVASQWGLGLVLTLLAVNFLCFNYYFQKVGELQTVSELNGINKTKLNRLSVRIAEKERRVDALLASGNSKSSYYLDKIGQSIPNSVTLHQIQYQPLPKPPRDDKPIEIQANEIIISGSSSDSHEFSHWIKQLERETWVDKAETLDFDYEHQGSSSFSIKIQIHEQ